MGGTIYNKGGNLIVTSSTFTDNTANGDGGAIENFFASNLNITNSTFIGNTADNGGAINNMQTCTVTDSTFSGNTATYYGGGAISNTQNLIVNNSKFINNNAKGISEGGAILSICVAIGPAPPNANIKNCTFNNNTAINGGVIYDDGTLNLTWSILTDNKASVNGGAVCNDHNGIANVNENQFIGNSAITGSAIYNGRGSVNANHNWWGSNAGPSAGAVYGDVNVSPWLVKIVSSVNPINYAVNIPINKVIIVTFGEYIKTGNSDIQFINSKGVEISFNKTISGNKLIITPKYALIKGTEYTLILHTGCVTDLTGNPLALYSSSFTTTKI